MISDDNIIHIGTGLSYIWIREAPLALMLYADDGEVLCTSKIWSEVSGYAVENLSTTAEYAKRTLKGREKDADAFIRSAFDTSGIQHEQNFPVILKDGRERICDFYSCCIGQLPDGRRIAMSAAIDVTDRSRLHSYILQKKVFFETTLASVADGVISTDKAGKIKFMIRKSDMAARLGGEEFAVVLPQTNRAEAEAAAEKIREKMNGTFHRTAGVVTASIGVAERAPSEPFESWYRRADEGVYAAKHRGRNQIVSVEYTHLQPEPVRHQVWQNAWNSGSELIDGEHLSLITLGNEILDMAYADAPFDVIMKQLDAIILHAGKHFSDEQRILEQIDYPDYRAHVRIHTVLIEKVAYLRDSFRDTRIKSPGFFSFIINDLIIGHLQEEDSKFYSYTRK